jgi:Yip1 domain
LSREPGGSGPGGTAAPPPSAVETGPSSAVGRLVGSFFSPGPTFASIAARPTWILPFSLWIASAILGSVLLLPRMNWDTLIREQAEKQGVKLTDAEVETRVERSRQIFWLFDAITVTTAALFLLVPAVVFWAALQAFGREVRFPQSLGVTAHAFLPQLLASVMFVILILRMDKVDRRSVGDLVRSNLGFLADAKQAPALHSLLQSVDVFTLWSVALLSIGYAAAAKISRGKAAAMVVTFWFLFVIGKAGVAALFG